MHRARRRPRSTRGGRRRAAGRLGGCDRRSHGRRRRRVASITASNARSAARRSSAPETSVRSGPNPARLSAAIADGKATATPVPRILRRRREPCSERHARTCSPPPPRPCPAAGLRDGVDPRVHRAEHRLVVLGPRRPRRRARASTRAISPAPSRSRIGTVVWQVAVVAVHRVDVVAQPHPRIGSREPWLARATPAIAASGSPLAPVDAASRPSGGGGASAARRSSQPRSRRWSWLPGTITTSAPAPSARPIARAPARQRRARRASGRGEARACRRAAPAGRSRRAPPRSASRELGAAQHIRLGARAEMQVGDDQGAQGADARPTRSPSPGGSPWGA